MTRYAIPDPPPAHITTLWDDTGGIWYRVPGTDCWVSDLDYDPAADAIAEDAVEDALEWHDLVSEFRVSTTPPEETP